MHCFYQVAAQTGHNVTMLEVSDDILAKTHDHIQKSLVRVAKKKFESPEVSVVSGGFGVKIVHNYIQ